MRFIKRPVVSWEDKKEIIQQLYDKFNINRFRYTIISDKSQLEFLRRNQHYILLNYKSQNFLLFFLFLNGVKTSVLIDRKTLSFQPKSIEDVVRSASIDILEFYPHQIKPDLYIGTLLDVKIVNNLFYVYNIFMWKGEDKCNESTLENFRLFNNEKLDNIQPVKEYYYTDLPKLKVIIREDPKVTGLVFVPKIPGNQMLFLANRNMENNNTITKGVNGVMVNNTNGNDRRLNGYGNNGGMKSLHPLDCHNLFLMHPQPQPDVYHLERVSSGGGTKHNRVLAYIPDMKTSHKWRSLIKDRKPLYVKCEYMDSMDKYIPREIVPSTDIRS